ncbi:MAG TPA: SDR family oxidoreductase, partial [Myxococcota bacterium]
MSVTVFVTGATGTIGREVVNALAERGNVNVRVGVRKDSFAKVLKHKNVTPVAFDWDDKNSYSALAGSDRVFVATPGVPESHELVQALVAEAKKAGVNRIVKLSSGGADADKPIRLAGNHRKGELAVEKSGIAYTLLRPGMFADNFINYWPPQKDGNIYLPFGTAKLALIDARDVGVIAAAALLDEGYAGKALELSGAAALDVNEVAAVLSKVTGRAIKYVDVSEDDAKKGMAGAGMPPWMVDDFAELYAIAKQGWLAG